VCIFDLILDLIFNHCFSALQFSQVRAFVHPSEGCSFIVLVDCIMSPSCSSSGTALKRPAGPRMEGRHSQFSNLSTLIDGQVVACTPPKNQFREPNKIPYDVPRYEPNTPSWSSCKCSSTPNILSIEEEVVYPWKIE